LPYLFLTFSSEDPGTRQRAAAAASSPASELQVPLPISVPLPALVAETVHRLIRRRSTGSEGGGALAVLRYGAGTSCWASRAVSASIGERVRRHASYAQASGSTEGGEPADGGRASSRQAGGQAGHEEDAQQGGADEGPEGEIEQAEDA